MKSRIIKRKSELEFIVIMASLMSLAAFSIDALLPGLIEIGKDLGITDSRDNQLLIIMIFLGLGVGQLVSGPLSDTLGRKPVIFMGYFVFALASLLCISAKSIEIMVAGRFLQGIGLSAPRTISMAMVRDRFSGNYMARVMSFITVIFILVPVIAPSFGKMMLLHFNWKAIFMSQLMLGLLVISWVWWRQPETLIEANKKQFKITLFADGVKEFIKHRNSVVSTLIVGLISGAFMAYISSSQQIFQEQYGLVDEFPYIFSGLAAGIGLATFLNGNLVVRFGMFKLASFFMLLFALLSVGFAFFYYNSPNPSSTILIVFFGLMLFFMGFMFGNVNALAMQPIGHIAGIGAAILGFTSTLIAVPIASFIGSLIQDSVFPLFVGLSKSVTLSTLLIYYLKYADNKELKVQPELEELVVQPVMLTSKEKVL
jgi:DHA1 family bicyclomycin/chloramphenicol resistance-like MFS transporter